METPIHGSVNLSLQPRGAVMAGSAMALIIAGLWRVDGVLAALGVAAACLLALSWVLAKWNPTRLDLTVDGPQKTQAAVVFPITLTLLNRRRWLDAFALRIELNLAGMARTGGTAIWVAAGSAADLELRVAVPGRTFADRHQARLVSDFPFGFFQAERTLELRHPLWVLPKPIVPRGLWFSGGRMDAPHAEGAALGEAVGELRGLRPWRAGDSPRRLVWPATLRSMARGGEMIVREADPPGFRPLRCAVVFHSFGTDGGLIRPDRFEKALSLAAGTLRLLHAQGIATRWIADFNDWQSRPASTRIQIAACLENLAHASRAKGSEAHDLQAAFAGIGEDEGLIVLSDMPVAGWQATLPKTKPQAFIPDPTSILKLREVRR